MITNSKYQLTLTSVSDPSCHPANHHACHHPSGLCAHWRTTSFGFPCHGISTSFSFRGQIFCGASPSTRPTFCADQGIQDASCPQNDLASASRNQRYSRTPRIVHIREVFVSYRVSCPPLPHPFPCRHRFPLFFSAVSFNTTSLPSGSISSSGGCSHVDSPLSRLRQNGLPSGAVRAAHLNVAFPTDSSVGLSPASKSCLFSRSPASSVFSFSLVSGLAEPFSAASFVSFRAESIGLSSAGGSGLESNFPSSSAFVAGFLASASLARCSRPLVSSSAGVGMSPSLATLMTLIIEMSIAPVSLAPSSSSPASSFPSVFSCPSFSTAPVSLSSFSSSGSSSISPGFLSPTR
mmetsp:Transcript_11847/g.49506  ORF Transcript_11847/g.49506 Transcript_11847/m.49506 type:complete len:349 (-) Transcript_11847:569-1615(-)